VQCLNELVAPQTVDNTTPQSAPAEREADGNPETVINTPTFRPEVLGRKVERIEEGDPATG
jgi:hypothetical protein